MMFTDESVRFSVVIPAYNAAGTIVKSINSVLSQSYPAKEIIIVDDGSEDNIREVIRKYADSVDYVSQANQGSAVARQTGSDRCTSDYIVYLDSDDWWPASKLEDLTIILKKEDVCFLLGDLDRAIISGETIEHLPSNTSFFPSAKKFHG